jgi:hypothetical protein
MIRLNDDVSTSFGLVVATIAVLAFTALAGIVLAGFNILVALMHYAS